MSVYKDLNHETTRTLRKTLGIPVKVCTLINRYKRRMGQFKHIDELWRIPGMTRKYFDLVSDTYTVTVPGKSPAKGKLKPFSWSTIVKPGDSDSGADSRSFPSLRDGWRKIRQSSPKPGTSGLKAGNYVVESIQMAPSCTSDPQTQSLIAVNMKKSPDNKAIKGKGRAKTKGKSVAKRLTSSPFSLIKSMAPVHISKDIEDQRRLLVPINVQQSPSGDRLCIIYSCSPKKMQSPQKARSGSDTAVSSKTPTAKSPARSKSPSILKHIDKPAVTKSDLEEPRKSPDRDKHVEFSLKESSAVKSSSGSYQSAKSQTRVIGKTKDRVYEEEEEVTMEAYVNGVSVPEPSSFAVASGAKVSEWIKSNKDFMKIGNIKEPSIEVSSSSRINNVDGREVITTRDVVTKEWVSPGRHRSPRRLSKDREILVKHRPAPRGIVSSKRRSPRRRRSPSSSPVKSRSPADEATRETSPSNPRARRESLDPRTRGEVSKGYRFYRKRHVREKSKEKTIRRHRHRKRDKEPEDSNQSCIVL